MTNAETLVTPEIESARGVWTDEETSYPISRSDIRKWAIAVYWGTPPPRIFWDEEYAVTTKWGGIIAPEDFNPFAWPVPLEEVKPAGALPGQPVGKGENILNGALVERFGVKMRPDDVISSRTRLTQWKERHGRHGLMLFLDLETEWTNQASELVKSSTQTLIRY